MRSVIFCFSSRRRHTRYWRDWSSDVCSSDLMTGPTDWVSGERVFAPPNGVLDVDWLVPAVLEALPAAPPADARAAIAGAWSRHRSGPAPARSDPMPSRAADGLADALRTFRSRSKS